MKKLILLITLVISVISCERDDICVEGTPATPHLIIRFYDAANQANTKDVPNLLIVGENNSLSYGVETTTDSIAIPLRILENNTTYRLYNDYSLDDNGTPDDTSDDIINGNPDDITLNYMNNQIFVSRACGFRNTFLDTSMDLTLDADNWITTFSIENNNIENETSAHIHIFH